MSRGFSICLVKGDRESSRLFIFDLHLLHKWADANFCPLKKAKSILPGKRSIFAYSMSHIFGKLIVKRLIWAILNQSLCILGGVSILPANCTYISTISVVSSASILWGSATHIFDDIFDLTNLCRACASKTLPYCWKELFCKLVFCFLSQSCDYFVSKCWFLCQNCVKLWNLWPSNFCVYHLQLGSLTLTDMTPAQLPRNKKTWDEMSLTLTSMWPLFQIYYLAQHVIELFFVFIGSLWKRER